MNNQNELFLEPKTKQYGSHMVMTNVIKPTKTKYITLDSKFSDEYSKTCIANFQYTLPERINEVRSMEIISMEIPMTIYAISCSMGNNSFTVNAIDASRGQYKGSQTIIQVPDGNYTIKSLWTTINRILQTIPMTYNLIFEYVNMTTSPDQYFMYYNSYDDNTLSNGNPYSMYCVDFANGNNDNFKNSLGWILGYRCPMYLIEYQYFTEPVNGWYPNIQPPFGDATGQYITDGQPLYYPEKMSDLSGPKYLYLALDEYNNGQQNSFLSQHNDTFVSKNIIAKIVLNSAYYEFGTIYPASKEKGNLFSDTRSYTGKVDLHKLNIKIMNEYGFPVDFNGINFGITIKLEHE
jgi:hypothetical protein